MNDIETESTLARQEDVEGEKIAIVTGANSGIGFEAAKRLAKEGIKVVMACRNLEKAELAAAVIKDDDPLHVPVIMELDLASLQSVDDFVNNYISEYDKLDILVNNAGLMAVPYAKTKDGFELQFGTNHLGHFALTSGLWKLLRHNSGARVVTITSIAHFRGMINFDDINSERSYSRMGAYRQSKLANLLFAYELDRRIKRNGDDVKSIAVHPGISSTNIVSLSPVLEKLKDLVLMKAEKGALPTVMGALDGNIKGGEYIGPRGFRQAYGYPAILRSGKRSYDLALAEKLWSVSEDLIKREFNV